MTQDPVARPFAEAYRGDERRLHPMDPARREPFRHCHGRRLTLYLREAGAQPSQPLAREAGPDPAGVGELATGRVVGEEQRAEAGADTAGASTAGIGEPHHDELLAVAAFDLDPLRSPTVAIS